MSDKVSAYADALILIAEAEGHVERIEEELFRVARAFEGSDELRTTLSDAIIPVDRRLGIVEDLLGAKGSPLTTAMVSFIVAAGRARDLPAIADAFVARAAERRAEEVAEVRSAVPLDEDQQRRLADALGKATGKRVTVKVIIDPTVLGGLVAKVGDTVIDGSVRHRLDQLKESV
jgi:F-type H+-transporting ATPase subunit delta